MPEANDTAAILINASWKAKERARYGLARGHEDMVITDCMITIVFAAFFIEANLNHIIKKMGVKKNWNMITKGRLAYRRNFFGFSSGM